MRLKLRLNFNIKADFFHQFSYRVSDYGVSDMCILSVALIVASLNGVPYAQIVRELTGSQQYRR